jgi:hypothetical protein
MHLLIVSLVMNDRECTIKIFGFDLNRIFMIKITYIFL